MDKIKGVITGDIIDSSAIQIEYRDFLLKSIQKIAEELNVIEPLKIEFLEGIVSRWLSITRKTQCKSQYCCVPD